MRTEDCDRRSLLGLAGLVGVAAMANAGPINPPAGPVGPTGKSLAEIEPRTPLSSLPGSASAQHVISQPGSYVLTGSIDRVPGKSCIQIAADGVVLDLNGFALNGNRTSGGIESGIELVAQRANIIVRNGIIRDWPFYGVIGFAASCTFEDLHLTNNNAGGLEVIATNTCVRRCVVKGVAELSISVGRNAMVADCTVDGGVVGINAGDACVVQQCSVFGAFTGISIASGRVSSCAISLTGASQGLGISASGATLIDRCTVSNCSLAGVSIMRGCTLIDNTIDSNGIGVRLRDQTGFIRFNRIERNAITGNTFGFKSETAAAPGNFIAANILGNNGAAFSLPTTGNKIGTTRADPAEPGAGPWDNFVV